MRTCGLIFVAACLSFGFLRAGAGDQLSADKIARLVMQLGDDHFSQREAASEELNRIGEPALDALRKSASSDDPEVRYRAEQIRTAIVKRVLAVASKKELEGLQGTWQSIETEVDGVRQTGAIKPATHVFKGDRLIGKDGEKVFHAATLKVIEVAGKRVKIDFVITEGDRRGDTWIGVFERSGDELKWCGSYASDGYGRPAALATKPGDGHFFRALKRVKK